MIKKRALSEMDSKLRQAFSAVKTEFDEHLKAINENTNEIQANYEFLCEIDARLSKLEERFEEVIMILSSISSKNNETPIPQENNELKSIKPLTQTERKVFLALYTLGEASLVTYQDIAEKLSTTTSMVECYISNLLQKGIPIIKRYINSKTYLRLEPLFREQQTKENLVNITTILSKSVESPIEA